MILHVITACHNRRDLTARALSSFANSCDNAGVDYHFTLFDDGSEDGTAELIAEFFPESTILRGSGSAFWARSMSIAEQHVFAKSNVKVGDYIVWLNDDVNLDEDCIIRLLPVLQRNPNAPVAAAMIDPVTKEVTYSGFRQARVHPLRFTSVSAGEEDQPIDTFNGNLVLVPLHVARRVGGIDGEFAHALADIDYGIRCWKAGLTPVLAPGTYGECPRNPPTATVSLIADWKNFLSVKGGGHPSSMRRILCKSKPLTWPFFMFGSYALWWARAMLKRFHSKGTRR